MPQVNLNSSPARMPARSQAPRAFCFLTIALSDIVGIMDDRNRQLKDVSTRLFWALAVLAAIGVAGAVFDYSHSTKYISTPLAILFVGFIGGFIGLQRRLKTMAAEDLTLLADSWVCTALSPVAGALLAVLVYLLFISGLLTGSLFPKFANDADAAGIDGFRQIFHVHCVEPADYAKLLFWSFVAGFSEKFVTNIINQFDSGKSAKLQPAADPESDSEAKTGDQPPAALPASNPLQ
jgi:hypothetical protein